MKNIAEKTKKLDDITGILKGKFGGKQDVKDVLSVVSVSRLVNALSDSL